MTDSTIKAAIEELEQARQHFDRIEAQYFAGKATESTLRQAWDALQQAQRAAAAAHRAWAARQRELAIDGRAVAREIR